MLIFKIILLILSILSIVGFVLVINDKSCKISEHYTFEPYKLNVIIPIRDRDQDLEKITNVLEHIFQKQGISARYIIIEQESGKPFNKAKISNAGFLEAEKNNYSNNYLFNDVDLWPLNDKIINYKDIDDNSIKHKYGTIGSLGGFLLMKNHTFRKLNGYSNDYWGWGAEDTDLERRSDIMKVKIDRNNFINRWGKGTSEQKGIRDDISDTRKKDPDRFEKAHVFLNKKTLLYRKNKKNILSDGLSNIDYNIVSIKDYKNNPNMKRILISI